VTDGLDSPDIWWDTTSRTLRLRPHVFEGRAGKRFKQRWQILTEMNLTEVGFMYEIDARLDPVSGAPGRYQWRKTGPRYAYGKPFHLLSDHGYLALQDACAHWMHEHPKRGHEGSNVVLGVYKKNADGEIEEKVLVEAASVVYLPGDWPVPVGRGPWTELITDVKNVDGKRIHPFAINLSKANRAVKAVAESRAAELNLGHRGIARFMGLVKTLRAEHGVPSPPARPDKDEARNLRPWNHATTLVKAERHAYYRRNPMNEHAAKRIGAEKFIGVMDGSLRQAVHKAETFYSDWTAKFPLRLIDGRRLNPWFVALSNTAVHDSVMRDAPVI
jgi:hypothetical protein